MNTRNKYNLYRLVANFCRKVLAVLASKYSPVYMDSHKPEEQRDLI